MNGLRKSLNEKLREALASVLPIIFIVLALCFSEAVELVPAVEDPSSYPVRFGQAIASHFLNPAYAIGLLGLMLAYIIFNG